MDDRKEQIRKGFQEMAKRAVPLSTLLATVESVDETAFTCVLLDDDSGLEFPDVRLRPVLDGKESLTIFPKVGTWVHAIRIEDDDDWMLIAAGEIDKWRLSIGNITIDVSSSGVIFNGGSLGGLIKIEELKSELDKVNQVLFSLMSIISGTPITEPGNGAPSAFQTALNGAITGKTLPDYTTIEDTQVKH